MYKREVVSALEFMSGSVYDLEYSVRPLVRDVNNTRLILGKPRTTRASNQEVEMARNSYISGFKRQNAYDFTVSVQSRAPNVGTKKSLSLGVDAIGSTMVKDLSARLRSGSRTAVGTLTRVNTNAESDAAAKRILRTVSEGDIIINSSYMQLQVLINYVNYLHAADEQAQGRLSMYNNGGTHCGATNVTLFLRVCLCRPSRTLWHFLATTISCSSMWVVIMPWKMCYQLACWYPI